MYNSLASFLRTTRDVGERLRSLECALPLLFYITGGTRSKPSSESSCEYCVGRGDGLGPDL